MMPEIGDTIMIVKRDYADLILSGDKTIELRCRPIKRRCIWLGQSESKEILAKLDIGKSTLIDDHDYQFMQSQHKCNLSQKPYKKTYAIEINRVDHIQPIRYQHKRGAIGFIRYDAIPQDMPNVKEFVVS